MYAGYRKGKNQGSCATDFRIIVAEHFATKKLYYLILIELEMSVIDKTTLYALINNKNNVDSSYFETCVQELIDQDLLIIDGVENLTSIIFITKNV